jgi:lipopolysaccharide transport system permease protein
VILFFTRQDLVQRFIGNGLGFGWAIIAPLAQMALFSLIFVHVFKARLTGLEGVSFVSFLSLGMWPYFAFSEAVSRGLTSLTDQASLLTKVAVSPWHLVVARVNGAFLVHGIGFVLVVAVLATIGEPIHAMRLLLTLPSWAGLYLLALGCALWLAVGNVFVRDLKEIVTYLLSAAMFLSPIMYTTGMAPPFLQPWLRMNPLTGFVEGVRDTLLGVEGVALFPWQSWLAVALIGALGVYCYRRVRPHVIEFL